jgi:uncharacterized protein YjbJ (UPF0337 family)
MSSGTGDKVKGRIEKAAGDLTGDPNLHDRGTIDETSGKVKDSVERGVNKVRDVLNEDTPADRDLDRNRKP